MFQKDESVRRPYQRFVELRSQHAPFLFPCLEGTLGIVQKKVLINLLMPYIDCHPLQSGGIGSFGYLLQTRTS